MTRKIVPPATGSPTVGSPGIETRYGDEEFVVCGSQLMSEKRVQMCCKYRNDGGPARFIVGEHRIPATVEYIQAHDELGLTTVGNGAVNVRHIEHILSALCGMSVLDTDIELSHVDGTEVVHAISPPVMQLNSREFAFAILSCFLTNRAPDVPVTGSLWPNTRFTSASPITLDRCYVFTEEPDHVRHGDPAVAIFAPLHKLHITVHINFPSFLRTQIYSQDITPLDYLKSISWARSFFGSPFPHAIEWEQLRRRFPGLVRDRENHFRSMMIDYTEDAWITPVVVNTEPVRHKMLDVIGDLALLGRPLHAGLHIYKPSHRFNRTCAREIARLMK